MKTRRYAFYFIQRLFLCLLIFTWSKGAHAFALLGSAWQISDITPICWALDPDFNDGVTRSEAEVRALITEALLEWQDVETSILSFTECALPSVDLDDLFGVETNTIIVQIKSSIGASTGGCTSFVANTANIVCNGARVNFSPTAASSSDAGFKATILHEFGHAVGLGHSDKKSVMSYHYDSFSLTSDDKAAISFLYPKGNADDFAPPGCGTIDIGSRGGGPPNGFLLFFLCISMLSLMIRNQVKKKARASL